MAPPDPSLLRADARRNRERILQTAGELFAARGRDAQMDEIADAAELGMGTLYRHFPTKQALLAAIIGRRFDEMTVLARAAAEIADPGTAFATLLRTYLEAAERDAAFRLAVLGPERPDWDQIAAQKDAFTAVVEPILARAAAAGQIRSDFTIADFVLVTRALIANMTPTADWRRHLTLTLEGLAWRHGAADARPSPG